MTNDTKITQHTDAHGHEQTAVRTGGKFATKGDRDGAAAPLSVANEQADAPAVSWEEATENYAAAEKEVEKHSQDALDEIAHDLLLADKHKIKNKEEAEDFMRDGVEFVVDEDYQVDQISREVSVTRSFRVLFAGDKAEAPSRLDAIEDEEKRRRYENVVSRAMLAQDIPVMLSDSGIYESDHYRRESVLKQNAARQEDARSRIEDGEDPAALAAELESSGDRFLRAEKELNERAYEARVAFQHELRAHFDADDVDIRHLNVIADKWGNPEIISGTDVHGEAIDLDETEFGTVSLPTSADHWIGNTYAEHQGRFAVGLWERAEQEAAGRGETLSASRFDFPDRLYAGATSMFDLDEMQAAPPAPAQVEAPPETPAAPATARKRGKAVAPKRAPARTFTDPRTGMSF